MDVTRQARGHHHEFAHRALPAIMLDPAIDLATTAEDPGQLDDALLATWREVGSRHPGEQLGAAGLSAQLRTVGRRPGLLVTLPTPLHPTEAYFVLVTPLAAEGRRLFTLELAWDVVTRSTATVLGGWRPEGHLNLGAGPQPDADAFVDAVARRL